MKLGVVIFHGNNLANTNNVSIAFSRPEYSGLLQTSAAVDMSLPDNADFLTGLNINSDTILFIDWTNAEQTQFNTITRMTGIRQPDEIANTIDLIIANEPAIDSAQGGTEADILSGDGSGGNQDSSNGFGFGDWSFDFPWWIFAVVAIGSGIKSSSSRGTVGKVAWGAFGLYSGIQTAKKFKS